MGYPTGGYQVVGGPPPGYPVAPLRPTSPDGQPLAEFSDRLLARLIDGAIVGAVSLVIIGPIYVIALFSLLPNTMVVNGDPYGESADATLSVLLPIFGIMAFVILFSFAFSYLYNVELVVRMGGQTFGKRAMKIRIAPLEPGQPLTRGVAFKRFLVELVCGIVPGLSWVDGLWQLWDQPYRQCLHDKYAKTVVTKIVV